MRDERAFLADMLFDIVWSTATADMEVLIAALEQHLGPAAGEVGGATA